MQTDDLISRSALMKYINDTHPYAGLPMAAHICTMELLTYAPAVDAKEVVHAQWLTGYPVHCSACGGAATTEYEDCNRYEAWLTSFCPHCGATMDSE